MGDGYTHIVYLRDHQGYTARNLDCFKAIMNGECRFGVEGIDLRHERAYVTARRQLQRCSRFR